MEVKPTAKEYCRTCFSNKSDMYLCVFERKYGTKGNPCWAEIISYCFSTKVDANDVLPKKVCIQCSYQLSLVYKFKKRFDETQAILKRYLESNTNISVKEEEEETVEGTSIKIEESCDSEKQQNTSLKEEVHKSIDNTNVKIVEPETEETTCQTNISLDSFALEEQRKNTNSSKEVKIEEIKKYCCLVCKEKFKWRKDLFKHINIHDPPFVCKICDKYFGNTYKNLQRHSKIHEDIKHLCATCGRSFNTPEYLKRHLITHSGAKRYVCQQCNKRFANNSTLRQHLMIHSGERRHMCPTCGNTFRRLSSLKVHVISHENKKNFPCHLCPKSFNHAVLRTRHMTSHTGERKFVCQVCGKSFLRSSNLIIHKRIHTDDRRFKCILCGKRFMQRYRLARHMNTHC